MPNSSCNFPNRKSVFLQILHDSSVSCKLTPLHFFRSNVIYMVQKEQIKVQILETFKQSGQNLPNSCYFWNNKSVFLQILLHSSVSWDVTLLYFFTWNFIYLQQKKPIKLQIWWSFTGEVKSLKFCILMGSFCPNDIKFHLKKWRRVISYDTEEWCKVYAKYDRKNEKYAKYAKFMQNMQNMTEIWWIFT